MSSKCIRDTVNKVKTKYQESDPYRLAAAMHIIVKKLPLGTDPNCCKGFCMRECRKTCIVINCDLPEIIQQIILIHEIGHALLHQKPLQIKCFHDFELFDGVSQCEYEANCLLSFLHYRKLFFFFANPEIQNFLQSVPKRHFIPLF